ncbi:lipase family protein [Rhodococcus sp. W8901]|uniref:lipase family protein n=1 Tax=Rhodococcus sp. W8901 TaxID=2742603 RepID=UPI00158443B4|nr:lipase family protein [Rhodococcus sp. W8901]QKT11139.1 lipase [Rhodococcus sp. W8901]
MTGSGIGRRIVTAIAVALIAGAPQILAPAAQAVPAVTPARDDPGSVLESAPLPRSFWLPGTGAAHRITYLTTGPRGDTPCTGMVFVPAGPPPPGGWPVIAWAHGTIGDSDTDAPSVNGVDAASSRYVANWLARGYAVAATDYIGLGTPGVPPYLDGKSAAHSVIDSVRAARAVDDRLSSRWAVVGLSEGGQAAVFTAHAATEYAPELDYRGAVAAGVPSNIETIAPLAGPNFPPQGLAGLTNFMTFVIAGFRDTHPELDVNSFLTPIGRTLVDAAPELPYPQFARLAANVSVAQMLSRSLNDPALLAALRDYLQVPTSGFDRPLMIAQGATDLTVPLPLTVKLVADMNLAGTRPDFRIYPADHIGSLFANEADAVTFVTKVFECDRGSDDPGCEPASAGSIGSS